MTDELEDFYNEVMCYLESRYPRCWLRQAFLGKEWITLMVKFPRVKEAKVATRCRFKPEQKVKPE